MDHILDDDQKIRLVSMHVFGKALNWHTQFMKRFRQVVTWNVYETHVRKRFESVFEDPVMELKNLKQTTNVQVYQETFEALLNKVDLPESCIISLFIGGLKDEIAYAVRMFRPTTLIDVLCLAKLQEANISVTKSRSALLLTNPRNSATSGYVNRGGGNVLRPVNNVPVVNQNRPFKKLSQQELEEKKGKALVLLL